MNGRREQKKEEILQFFFSSINFMWPKKPKHNDVAALSNCVSDDKIDIETETNQNAVITRKKNQKMKVVNYTYICYVDPCIYVYNSLNQL